MRRDFRTLAASHARYRCAGRLSGKARLQANIHAYAAAHTAEASTASVCWADLGLHAPKDVKFLHELLSKRYLAVAEVHTELAKGQREKASDFAAVLTNKLTDCLVRHRLDALDPETAANITRVFGADLSDPLIRARVFEVCDWLQFGGGDEDRLVDHMSIPLRRE